MSSDVIVLLWCFNKLFGDINLTVDKNFFLNVNKFYSLFLLLLIHKFFIGRRQIFFQWSWWLWLKGIRVLSTPLRLHLKPTVIWGILVNIKSHIWRYQPIGRNFFGCRCSFCFWKFTRSFPAVFTNISDYKYHNIDDTVKKEFGLKGKFVIPSLWEFRCSF